MSALEDTFRRVLREEAILAPPPQEPAPLPTDSAAEQILLAAVLNQEHRPSEFPELRPSHFSEPLRRAVWDMASALVEAGHEPRLEPILAALQDQGFGGPVAEHLLRIRDRSPSVATIDLETYAARVTELWRRRQLIGCLVRLGAELRCGTTDHAGAKQTLRQHFQELPR